MYLKGTLYPWFSLLKQKQGYDAYCPWEWERSYTYKKVYKKFVHRFKTLPPFEEKTVLSIREGLLPVASPNFQAYTRKAATLKLGEALGSRLFPYT
jgi:hypothetical protein